MMMAGFGRFEFLQRRRIGMMNEIVAANVPDQPGVPASVASDGSGDA